MTIPVLAAVITRGDRYLVCQRPSHKRHGGLWEFPGGKLEPNETLLQAAQRELSEELDVSVTAIQEPLLSVRDPGSEFVIHFVPVTIQGEPQCFEHAELQWVGLHELASIELAPSDHAFAAFLVSLTPDNKTENDASS